MNIHEKYMRRCIDLAKNGLGQTYPNPMVGCVIVHNNKIIGEGWHHKAGEPHAEVNAIQNIKDESLIKDSTLYVSLEPCSHFGKTPPCADLIIDKGFKKVIIGTADPFAKVKGRGIQKLIKHGCQVILGVLEDECLALNKRFMTFHKKQRPYIILKWAESADGFLSPFVYGHDTAKEAVWLTNAYAKQLVHKWRSEEQAIMVGTHTALMDNPALTTRLWQGQNPVRILIDKDSKISLEAKIFSKDTKTLVFTKHLPKQNNLYNQAYFKLNFEQPILPQLLIELHHQNLQSLIVEGGAVTLQYFINQNLWDEARVFKSPKKLHNGTPIPIFKAQALTSKAIIQDKLTIYKNG